MHRQRRRLSLSAAAGAPASSAGAFSRARAEARAGTVGVRTHGCHELRISLPYEETPNEMMRIGERMGLYSAADLQLDSPVYPTLAAWVGAHS